MKKLLLASAAAAALVAGSAAAENDFTGFNFGLQGGVAHSKADYKNTFTTRLKESNTGAVLGAFAGYGYQFDNAMYLGGELESNYFTGEASKTLGGFKVKTKAKYDVGANLRAGYVFDNVLVYALAGLNATKVEGKVVGVLKGSETLKGLKVGAGAEMKFMDNYFARAQYDYKMNKKKDGLDFDQHNARVGLGMII